MSNVNNGIPLQEWLKHIKLNQTQGNILNSTWPLTSPAGVAPALVELFGARDISLKYSVCLSGELFGCALFYILSVGSVKIYNELVTCYRQLIDF